MARDLIVTPRDLVRDCKCSLAFDGTDDYLAGSNPLSGDQAWSVCARVLFRKAPASFSYVAAIGTPSSYGGPILAMRATRQFMAGHFASGCTPEPRLEIGRWYDLTITHPQGAGRARAYVDGVQTGQQGANSTSAGTGATAFLAAYSSGSGFGNVLLSEVRVYTRELSPGEVADWSRGREVDPTGLARRWTLEDGLGLTAYEEIAGTNDPITGALWSPFVPFSRRSRLVNVPAAVRFPGTNFSFVTIPDHVDLRPGAGSWGVMFWFRQAKPFEWASLVQKGVESGGEAGWVVGRSNSGLLSIRVADGVSTTLFAPGANIGTCDYFHLALVCDRSSGKLNFYVNAGPPITSALGSLGSVDVAHPLRLGGVASWTNKFVGSQGEMIWRKGAPFTWDEIRDHYFDGTVPECPAGCKQIGWAMDEGSGTTAHSSPAGYDGTLLAESWTTSTRSTARSAASGRDAA